MARSGSLLGGGGGGPLDLYGDLFTDEQKQALQQRELSQGLLSFAAKLGAASAPSREPKSGFLGLLGQAAGGFASQGDEQALKGMEIAEKVRTARQERATLGRITPIVETITKMLIGQGIPAAQAAQIAPQIATQVAGGGGAPAGGPPASNAPPPPPSPGGYPSDIGNIAGPDWSPLTPPGVQSGAPPTLLPTPPAPPGGAPGQQSLLPPPPGANPQMGGTLSADLYGGAASGTPPFNMAALDPGPSTSAQEGGDTGLPDLGQIQVELLSGQATPVLSDETLRKTSPVPSLGGAARPASAWQQGYTYDQPKVPYGQAPEDQARPGGGYGASRADTVAYWRSRGMPQHVAEGIADRVGVESSYRSDAIGDKGTSGGLYQHHADRLARLKNFAANEGKPWTDPDVQHRFAGSETQGGDPQATRGMSEIANAPDRQTAGKLWDRHFERSAAGPGSRLLDAGRVRVEPLSGEAAPAGRGGIAGTGVTPEALAALNAMLKLGGIKSDPFGSLLESYYKSPNYITEAARARAQGENDPLIIEQKKRLEFKIETELKPKLEAAVATAMNAPLAERAKAQAEIDRRTKELEQAGAAGIKIEEATVADDNGKPVTKKMTALEIAIRQKLTADRQAGERQATGQVTVKPGDIVGTPVLTPEETATQTQRGKSGQEMREIEVWTPTGPVKQTMSNQEIAAREKLAASRGPGGAPQIGDIINKPALTPADQKIADSLGEEFMTLRKMARAADKTIRDTHNLRSKLDSGMFTGLDANFNLFMARLGDTMGWKNLSDPEKVKNTETYIAGLGSEVLAMVKDLRPASNIDLQFAERMAGGQNLSAASIRQLLDMREEYARLAIQQHNEEAAGRNPAIFQGARRELPMPPAYQPKELTSPGGNRVIINR